MGRKLKSPKGRINGPTAMRSHSPGTLSMITLTKEVSKTVAHPQSGKDVKRSCKVSYPAVDPKVADTLEDQLTICGGDAGLQAKVFNFGLSSWIRQQETNKLGQTDEISKAAANIIGSYVKMLGCTPEEARAQLMANPLAAGKLATATFEQFVETAIEDFVAYQTKVNDKGISVSRFPDVTDVAEDEAEKTAEKPAE